MTPTACAAWTAVWVSVMVIAAPVVVVPPVRRLDPVEVAATPVAPESQVHGPRSWPQCSGGAPWAAGRVPMVRLTAPHGSGTHLAPDGSRRQTGPHGFRCSRRPGAAGRRPCWAGSARLSSCWPVYAAVLLLGGVEARRRSTAASWGHVLATVVVAAVIDPVQRRCERLAPPTGARQPADAVRRAGAGSPRQVGSGVVARPAAPADGAAAGRGDRIGVGAGLGAGERPADADGHPPAGAVVDDRLQLTGRTAGDRGSGPSRSRTRGRCWGCCGCRSDPGGRSPRSRSGSSPGSRPRPGLLCTPRRSRRARGRHRELELPDRGAARGPRRAGGRAGPGAPPAGARHPRRSPAAAGRPRRSTCGWPRPWPPSEPAPGRPRSCASRGGPPARRSTRCAPCHGACSRGCSGRRAWARR